MLCPVSPSSDLMALMDLELPSDPRLRTGRAQQCQESGWWDRLGTKN